MSEPQTLEAQLKIKRICRFCLSQNEPLSNIYSKENRLKSAAPLPLQVMATVSIEIFSNDGMPSFICEICRVTFDHCYRFKQMCKRADVTLRQYPLTGEWPERFEQPKIPDELVPKPILKILNRVNFESYPDNEIIFDMPVDTKPALSAPPPRIVSIPRNARAKPRLLNKNSIKILNKDAQLNIEPVISNPVIKRNDDGNVEIVTEILNAGDSELLQEPDPVKTATPVETNVFPCNHCERSFPLRQLLDIHMVNHSRQRSFECEICKKAFFSKYDLSKHALIHTGEKPYKCVICSKAFTRSTLLHRHQKTHIDIPKFICVFCEKPFLSKEEMEIHTERHRKNRPFECKICHKSFAFKQGLERHEVVHSKNQPFPCQYCDQSFSTPSKLSRHLTAHAGNRPYPCKLCPKSYLLSHHLTRHLRSHREGNGSYKCSDCEQVFNTRDGLIYHSALHATQNLTCPLCKDTFDDVETVTEHVRQHAEGEQYACEFCDLIFMTADKLQHHSDVEHLDDLKIYQNHDANAGSGKEEPIDGEIIEEFIIEEYTQDEQEQRFIKEEFVCEDTIIEQSVKSLEKKISVSENDYEYMELEGEYDSAVSNEHEPLAKVMKVEKKTPKTTPITKTISIINKSHNANAKPRKMSQPTIKHVIQNLPKSVTLVKRPSDPQTPNASRSIQSIEREVAEKMENFSPTENRVYPVKKGPRTLGVTNARPVKPETSPELTEPLSSPNTNEKRTQKNLVEMMIGDRKVKVQKITVTKAQAAAMAKEGRIEMKNGTMILKQQSGATKRKAAQN